MKLLIKKIASQFGYKISKTVDGYKLQNTNHVNKEKKPFGGSLISFPPPSNFDNIALVMEYFSKVRPGSTFVQIGANDGQTSDSVYSFVKRGVLHSFLVEPIPTNYEKLKNFYENIPNVVFINAAIGHKAGTASIYSVRDEGRWKDNAWATQLASFDKDHLIRHEIASEEIEVLEVEMLDFPSMLNRYNIPKIDVLQIDVEGFDAEIVDMALNLPNLPYCICFEYVQFAKIMDQAAVNAFYERLKSKGYRWSHDRLNTMAIHDSFVSSTDGEPFPEFLTRIP